MKIAIMQPYLFPYIGYFSLIYNTDRFVFFDTPQYIRKGWINRNRIISSSGEPIYFTVPTQKAARETAINQILINNEEQWQEKLYGQLSVYKNKAPYYAKVLELVHEVVDGEKNMISKLAIDSVMKTCNYLGIDKPFDVFSKMKLPGVVANAPDEWALSISKALGCDTYVNPPGGMSFFDRDKYKTAGIKLQFLQQELIPYVQKLGRFVEGLSIIDLMMFCKEDEIREMMEHYELSE